MAAEILTPACEVTGLPLPILPNESRSSETRFVNSQNNRGHNYHHLYHPDSDSMLADARGRALRGCRVMKTSFDAHTFYHQTFAGPELPTTDEEVFKHIVLSVAGVMPKNGIDITAPYTWIERPIQDFEYKRFSRPGKIKVEKAKNIARFISSYALDSRDDDLVTSVEIEEFVERKTSYKRRREIASKFLGESLDYLLSDLNPLHQQLKKEGKVLNHKSNTLRHGAKSLVRRHAFGYYIENLSDKAMYA